MGDIVGLPDSVGNTNGEEEGWEDSDTGLSSSVQVDFERMMELSYC